MAIYVLCFLLINRIKYMRISWTPFTCFLYFEIDDQEGLE